MKKLELFTPDPRWFEAPRERTPQFFLTYAKVSIALQRALRVLAVNHFFLDISRYQNQSSAYALLAYASSRPFRPLSRTDFTYDVTNATVMTTFFRMSRRKMIEALERTQTRLLAAGQLDLAKMYDPRDVRQILKTVKKQKRFRKPLHRLLVAEGKLLNELAGFSGLADASPKERLKKGASVVKKWHAILSHLCLGSDLSEISPELFEAATQAYLAVGKPEPPDGPGMEDEDEPLDEETEDAAEPPDDPQPVGR